jgi:hypothetical protein
MTRYETREAGIARDVEAIVEYDAARDVERGVRRCARRDAERRALYTDRLNQFEAALDVQDARDALAAELHAALLALSEALDPGHDGDGWPDPVEWAARPLAEHAADLLVLADTVARDAISDEDAEDVRSAASRVRAALVETGGAA